MGYGIVLAALVIGRNVLYCQSLQHPLHVVDQGGGASTSGGMSLQSSIGQPAVQAGTSGGLGLEAGYIPGFRQFGGASTAVECDVEGAWNMVSVPLVTNGYLKTFLYPTATSVAFAYTGSYQRQDTLRNLAGYWLKFPGPITLEFTGTAMVTDTASVKSNWNIIGCLSYPVRASNITGIGTSVTSNYYGYSGATGYYVADTLQPGRGYWVKVSSAGQLAMASGSPLNPPTGTVSIITKPQNAGGGQPAAGHNLNTLVIRDAKRQERTLYFSTAKADGDLSRRELPPIPPSFDVRYSSNREIEFAEQGITREIAIRITSAEYPLTLSWTSHDDASLVIGSEITGLRGKGSVTIENADQTVKLRLAPLHGEELPRQFALNQNYPNPFNPATVILYAMPEAGHVTLKVYSTLGQEVSTLVDRFEQAGYKSVRFDASGMPTGLYFYRLQAGRYASVRKMLLLK